MPHSGSVPLKHITWMPYSGRVSLKQFVEMWKVLTARITWMACRSREVFTIDAALLRAPSKPFPEMKNAVTALIYRMLLSAKVPLELFVGVAAMLKACITWMSLTVSDP
eukprot:2075586-Amphidinium_carterae.2